MGLCMTTDACIRHFAGIRNSHPEASFAKKPLRLCFAATFARLKTLPEPTLILVWTPSVHVMVSKTTCGFLIKDSYNHRQET
jgi:hypothetical protein